jgi:hypothetical protein
VTHDQSPVDLDTPIWGAREIGAVLNRSERKTFYLLEAGLLPAEKVGKSWVTTRRRLLALVQGEAV